MTFLSEAMPGTEFIQICANVIFIYIYIYLYYDKALDSISMIMIKAGTKLKLGNYC